MRFGPLNSCCKEISNVAAVINNASSFRVSVEEQVKHATNRRHEFWVFRPEAFKAAGSRPIERNDSVVCVRRMWFTQEPRVNTAEVP